MILIYSTKGFPFCRKCKPVQFPADLFTFTKEILQRKLQFFVKSESTITLTVTTFTKITKVSTNLPTVYFKEAR